VGSEVGGVDAWVVASVDGSVGCDLCERVCVADGVDVPEPKHADSTQQAAIVTAVVRRPCLMGAR
jgi:formate hydrogenlyase subunit 6/NADH:ubiquinone oxidoreductase subunit I